MELFKRSELVALGRRFADNEAKIRQKIYPTIFPCVDPPAPALSVFHGYLPEEPREFFRLERNVNRIRSLVRSRSETSDLNSSADPSI